MGNQVHEGRRTRQRKLKELLEHTLDNNGTTIIPGFSLGRTQELLYEFNAILSRLERKGSGSLEGRRWVVLDGQRYGIKAQVHTLSGYSAHAD